MVPKLRFSDPNTSPGQVAKVVVGVDVRHRHFIASCLFEEGESALLVLNMCHGVYSCLQDITERLRNSLRETGLAASGDPQAAQLLQQKLLFLSKCVIVSEFFSLISGVFFEKGRWNHRCVVPGGPCTHF